MLKTATSQVHADTERLWTSDGVFRDQGVYFGWLGGMLVVHARLGLPAARMLGSKPYCEQEKARAAAIAEDLGHVLPVIPVAGNKSESWAWGVQYSVSGAALGASHLLRSDRLDGSWPRAYLDAMAGFARSGGLRDFLTALNAQDLDHGQAVAGARDVFQVLQDETTVSEKAD